MVTEEERRGVIGMRHKRHFIKTETDRDRKTGTKRQRRLPEQRNTRSAYRNEVLEYIQLWMNMVTSAAGRKEDEDQEGKPD